MPEGVDDNDHLIVTVDGNVSCSDQQKEIDVQAQQKH